MTARHTEWPAPEPRTNADTAWALVTRFADGRLFDTILSGGVLTHDEETDTHTGTYQRDDDGAVNYIDWEQVAALYAAGEWSYLSSSEHAILDLAIRLGTGPDLWMLDQSNDRLVTMAIHDGLTHAHT